jgi:hypothetical protein
MQTTSKILPQHQISQPTYSRSLSEVDLRENKLEQVNAAQQIAQVFLKQLYTKFEFQIRSLKVDFFTNERLEDWTVSIIKNNVHKDELYVALQKWEQNFVPDPVKFFNFIKESESLEQHHLKMMLEKFWAVRSDPTRVNELNEREYYVYLKMPTQYLNPGLMNHKNEDVALRYINKLWSECKDMQGLKRADKVGGLIESKSTFDSKTLVKQLQDGSRFCANQSRSRHGFGA